MRVFLGRRQVLLVAEEQVGVEQHLVHAAVLTAEEALEGALRHLRHEIDAPVGHLVEQFLGHVAMGVDVGIAQTGQHLVLTVERHPAPVALNLRQVALVEGLPRVVDGLAADEAVEALGVLVVLVLAVLQHLEHIVQALFQLGALRLVVRGGVGHGQCRHIVAADVAAQVEARVAAPVGEVGVLRQPVIVLAGLVGGRCQSGLAHEGCQQAVDVVLHQQFDVFVQGGLHRTVEQGDLLQVEVLRVEQALGLGAQRANSQKGDNSMFPHIHILVCWF